MTWKSAYANTVVLITGGTGTLGHRLVRQLLRMTCGPRKIVVFSRDEWKQAQMRSEFEAALARLRFVIGDVRDADRLRRAFAGIDVVIHAAALKRIEVCENDPGEAWRTNVLGSQNVVDAAIECGVGRAVLVGTDKAVTPTTLYGATKLVAERLFVHGNVYVGERATRLFAVRYGNVLGSRGSVVEVWREQARRGLPLGMTGHGFTRFWWTPDEASTFVLRCAATAGAGEIHVPDLPAATLGDLAHAVATRQAWQSVAAHPSEKPHEALIAPGELAAEVDGGFVIGAGGRPHPGLTSDKARRLSVEDLKRLLANVEAAR